MLVNKHQYGAKIIFNMIINSIKQAFKRKKEKNWDVIYGGIDLHRTVLKPDYDMKFTFEYYPFAKETLILMNQLDIKLIMFTCSYPEEIEKYLLRFKEDGIIFDYVNKNPEVESCEYGYFGEKYHLDFGLDDKFGFDADIDWILIHDFLILMINSSSLL